MIGTPAGAEMGKDRAEKKEHEDQNSNSSGMLQPRSSVLLFKFIMEFCRFGPSQGRVVENQKKKMMFKVSKSISSYHVYKYI